jgi:hypothetical protein
VVAALVLLAFLGTGGERTDVAAHALGFVAGAAVGAGLPRVRAWRGLADGAAAAIAGALVALAWMAALL